MERRDETMRILSAGMALVAMALVGVRTLAAEQDPAAAAPEAEPLSALGFSVTGGAAPGYVDDKACGLCHSDRYRSYQEMGMARSFARPRPERLIEDFTADFFHEPSGRHYEMIERDGELTFRRYQIAADGEPINIFEQEIDWILGSGYRSRVYLYQTPLGELYQLPLAWYPQNQSWGMAPGYDRPNHSGVLRWVRRECMFCHNAYPEVPAGSDAYSALQTYPHELPEGLGCQRCHGPGAEHARLALGGELDDATLHGAIVNPARLSPQRRNDVCYECHMLPAVNMAWVRRFGRGDYSFRPGESLADFMVQLDPQEAGRDRSERFEINHHPYRLEQSRCFREGDDLSCLTCHDPHRKVPPEERAAHYRTACLRCHEIADCGEEHTGAASDCVACHMPARRTQDVVQVVMTDHWIRRRPGGPELVAPLAESEPVMVGVDFLWPERTPEGPDGEVYRAIGVLRAGGGAEAVDWLQKSLAAATVQTELEPFYELVKGQLRLKRGEAAQRTVTEILERDPEQPLGQEWLALTRAGLGDREQAIRVLRGTVKNHPDRPVAHLNLGIFLFEEGKTEEAIDVLLRTVELRPNQVAAWFYLGNAYAALDRHQEAVAHYRRALEIDPRHSRAYLAIGHALLARGQRGEALRWWRHGAHAAAQPGPIREALKAAEPSAPPAE